MAGDRARALARDIAADAATIIARTAGTAGGRASARDAARAALAPALTATERSALALLDRMLPTVAVDAAEADRFVHQGGEESVTAPS